MIAIELKKNSRSPKLELGEIDTRSPIQSVKEAVNLFGEASFSREKANPKLELIKIDTSSPIQSVKDAVNLFGEAAFSRSKTPIEKTKYNSAERVFSKETQLDLAQNELNKLKVKLEIAETTKSQAHAELDRAKQTIDELTHKLKVVSESKDFITTATEEAKKQVKLIEQDVEAAREKYSVAIGKLNSVKQLLMSIHHEYDASLAETSTAINQAVEAELAAKVSNNGLNELSREIVTLKESICEVRRETVQTQGEEAKIHRQNCIRRQLFSENLEESAKKLEVLRKKFDPELFENPEIQLSSTLSEIAILQFQIDYAKMTGRNSLKMVTSELEGSKESLHEVVQEECSMRFLFKSLKLDVESGKKEHYQLKKMETKRESAASNMHIKLQKAKLELEETLTGEAKVRRGASEERTSSFYESVLDGENAKHEVEEMMNQAEKITKESESTRIVLEEAGNNMVTALEEAEEVKTAETSALEEIKWLSERMDASCTSTSESKAHVSINREEFESLKRKIEKSDKMAEMKVAASMAEVEAGKASENQTLEKLEAMQKEIKEMKAIAHEARKKTKMANAARKAVEGELRRWRAREHKMQADSASRMLAESKIPMGLSPQNYLNQKLKQPPKKIELRRLENTRTSLTNLCCMCHKKRNKVDFGSPCLTCEMQM